MVRVAKSNRQRDPFVNTTLVLDSRLSMPALVRWFAPFVVSPLLGY
jgi:hypothetical protein